MKSKDLWQEFSDYCDSIGSSRSVTFSIEYNYYSSKELRYNCVINLKISCAEEELFKDLDIMECYHNLPKRKNDYKFSFDRKIRLEAPRYVYLEYAPTMELALKNGLIFLKRLIKKLETVKV